MVQLLKTPFEIAVDLVFDNDSQVYQLKATTAIVNKLVQENDSYLTKEEAEEHLLSTTAVMKVIYSELLLFQPPLGGLSRWLHLRDTSIIQPQRKKA